MTGTKRRTAGHILRTSVDTTAVRLELRVPAPVRGRKIHGMRRVSSA